ncbi:hypothetical protein MIND_01092100 [Mycena indigotica]|uniref:RRM domain-containing protein n=1 Tax=Mycena indigotica TaxID=2126181 RepID=A0A8H6S9M1_9AGAR|nr:uncharacterized protein MIND_01092100 [Mycena indigotica]KAF7295521.1 hypothetical protein MIND_01092100 [Mycena indigotica]
MSRRLYLGRLSTDTRSEDISKLFENYGGIIDCRVMTGFGFVEFESSKDAEDAVNNFNGKSFMGNNIVVEFAKESRPRRDREFDDRDRDRGDRGDRGARSRRPPGIRLIVSNLSRDTSWQDLKDFGREAGNVSFADIDYNQREQGVLEYLSRDDADIAVKELDGKDLRGRAVRVEYDDSRSGPDNYRRDDRGGGGGGYRSRRDGDDDDRGYRRRDDRDKRDRDRDDRRKDRSRSRSPRTRDRRRSPPRRERSRDRDDKKRDKDDKDGKDDRDRSAKNGDGGWGRDRSR